MMSKLGPALAARARTLRGHDRVEVHVFLAWEPVRESTSAVLGPEAEAPDAPAPTAAQRDAVIAEIKTRTARMQSGVLAYLDEQGRFAERIETALGPGDTVSVTLPRVARVRAHWIDNSVTAEVSPAVLEALAERDDVVYLELVRHDDLERILDAPPSTRAGRSGRALAEDAPGSARRLRAAGTPTWSVDHVKAPLVWQQGITGEGVVVAVIDTGVNYDHPDLRNRMWDGGAAFPKHGWNFSSGTDDDPMDQHGHGTSCAGIVAGDGTSGCITGVAPSARVMAIRAESEEQVRSGLQFAIDHKAHVISMSMSWAHEDRPDYPGWRRRCENVWAAGILHANSAGNKGSDTGDNPRPNNIGVPANSPPPWLHPLQDPRGGRSSAVACGATDSDDILDQESGRGPAAWGRAPYDDYPFAFGDPRRRGLLKPDLCAPGPGTLSCNWRYTLDANALPYSGFSKTSAAAAHVGGCFALLAAACIRSGTVIDPARIQEAVERTAVPIDGQSDPKENTFGAGRIDVYEAYKYGRARKWWR